MTTPQGTMTGAGRNSSLAAIEGDSALGLRMPVATHTRTTSNLAGN